MIFRFEDFELDEDAGELRRAGQPVALQPKPFELLRLLVRERDRVVPIRELLHTLWPDTVVTPSSLTRAVSHARRALGDTHRGALLRSHARRGYRFCATVEALEAPRASAEQRSARGTATRQETPAPEAASAFVGRDPARATLRECLARAHAGRCAVAIVRGPAGIGKTRLTEVFVDEAQASGWHAWIGRCRDGEGVPAYWPWIQILRRALEDPELREEAESLAGCTQVIAGLIPELERTAAEEAPRSAAAKPSVTEQSQFLFYDAVTRVLVRCARRRNIVVVLEDLQWAGAGALRLLEHLLFEAAGVGLLLIATVRDQAWERGHPLVRMLSILKQQDTCEEISLRGFSRREVGELLEQMLGRTPPMDLTSELYARTEGTPLFVREAIRLLSERGALERLEKLSSHGVHLPQRALDLIRRGLDMLSEATAELIASASVLGREFSLPALAEIAQCARSRALELLDEAIAAGIVTSDPRNPACYRFSHALYEEAAYRGLSAGTKSLLHHRAACRLERLHAHDLDHAVSELAHHHHRALAVGDPSRAAELALRAAERAQRLFAHDRAALHYEQALAAIEHCEPVDPMLRLTTQIALGEALAAGGDRTRRRAVLSEAMRVARALDRRLELARAAIAFCDLSEWAPHDPAAHLALEEALAALDEDDHAMRTRLQTRLAYLTARHSRAQAEPIARTAVEGARGQGEPQAMLDALYTLHFVISGPDDLEARASLIQEIARVATRCPRRDPGVIALMDAASDRIALGDGSGARALRAAAERLCGRDPHPLLAWHMKVYDTGLAVLMGDFDVAEQGSREALRIGLHVEHPYAAACHAAHASGVAFERGNPERMLELLEPWAEADGQPVHWVQALLGRAHVMAGRPDVARRILDTLTAKQLEDIPRNIRWTDSMVEIAGLVADLADRSLAPMLLEPLRSVRDHHGVLPIPICYGGPVTRCMARLELALDHLETASALFDVALAACRALGARPMQARILVEHAALLTTLGKAHEARVMLDAAAEMARELGMQRVLDRAQRARSDLG